MPRSPSARRVTASLVLLVLAALASSAASVAAAADERTTMERELSPSPAPAPAPAAAEEHADPSMDHSKHNHAQNAAAAAGAGAGAANKENASPSPPLQVPDHPCFADPAANDCANYTRPKGSWLPELARLCEAMDYMPGCTLWRECQASNRNEGYCHHPSLIGTICTDMPKMKGCEPYNALCKKGSVVPHCSQPGPLPNAPSTAAVWQAVQSMCSSHSMAGCEGCRQGVAAGAEGCRDSLKSLASLCSSMPGMRDCKQLATACSGSASDYFPKTCGFVSLASSGGSMGSKEKGGTHASLAGSNAAAAFDLPPMRMFLHTDAEDIVLARQWVPKSAGTVAAACLGAIAGGFLSQALRAARGAAEAVVAARLRRGGGRGLFSSPSAGARLGRNALRAVAAFASSALDLLLMLVAMTFSWSLILSVAAGYGLGALVFGALGEPRFGDSDGANENGNCELDGGSSGDEKVAGDGFSTSEGVHLHGGTESVEGASCCDMGGGIGHGKLSPTLGGNGDARGRGWFGKS